MLEIEASNWLEDVDRYEMDQNPPDWSQALTMTITQNGGADIDSLQLLMTEREVARGQYISRVGDGEGAFYINQAGLDLIRLEPQDVAPDGMDVPGVFENEEALAPAEDADTSPSPLLD